ncbi:MAG: lysophospholipid acyltransferase family protein [Anaerolineales bacterium]
MKIEYWAAMLTARGLTRLLCRIDDQSLKAIPQQGPLILVCNHINGIELAVVFPRLHPRIFSGYAKSETWDNPILGPIFNIWEIIPIQRGQPDITALRQGLQVLEDGKILAITPEGTRSGDGRLQQGHPGVVMLALHSGAPILPMVYYGNELFYKNIRRMRRTDFHIRVGRPFKIEIPGRVTTEMRRQITDEIMYQLALLLPPQNRGYYSDLDAASSEFLRLN